MLQSLAPERRPRPAELDTPYRAPETRAEEQMAGIWTEVLGFDPIGVEDNFFALGGDSLQMTQIASRIRDTFGVEISFPDFFDSPSIAQLVKLLENRPAGT